GKHPVEQNSARRLALDQRTSVVAVGSSDDAVAVALEVARHDVPDHGLVVDHEYGRRRHRVPLLPSVSAARRYEFLKSLPHRMQGKSRQAAYGPEIVRVRTRTRT